MTKPKGVESPGMVIGEQKGRAQIMISRAETRAPRVAMSSPNVIACSGTCWAKRRNSSASDKHFSAGSGPEGIEGA